MLGARRLTPVGYASDARLMPLYVVTGSSGNITLTPASATLSFSGATPTVSVGNNVTVSPSFAALAIAPATPTVTTTNYSTTTLTPASAALVITASTPAVTGYQAVATGGKTFYVPANRTKCSAILGTVEGMAVSVRIDWKAKVARLATDITSVAWTTISGTASIANAAEQSNITSALITTSSAGTSTIKVTATMADGQIDIVLIKVKCSALPNSVSDYQ